MVLLHQIQSKEANQSISVSTQLIITKLRIRSSQSVLVLYLHHLSDLVLCTIGAPISPHHNSGLLPTVLGRQV